MKKKVLTAIVIMFSILAAGCGEEESEVAIAPIQLSPIPIATPTPIPAQESTLASVQKSVSASAQGSTLASVQKSADVLARDPVSASIQEPTEASTQEPTEAPTQEPTEAPTQEPTEAPTQEPTEAPTQEPTEAPAQEPTDAPAQEPVPTPTPEPAQINTHESTPILTSESLVIAEREVKDGKIQSYLTGEWVDEAIGTRRPISVTVSNQTSCLPHYGITNAGVIYLVPITKQMTRFLPIFEDFDDLDRIGPVRSIRMYMSYLSLEHDAIVCNWGLAQLQDNIALINSDLVDNISQAVAYIDKPASVAFKRYQRSGYKEEDRGYLIIDGLMKGVDQRGYNWEYDDTFEPKFLFVADGKRATYDDAESATKIWPGEKGVFSTIGAYFEYNEETGKYDYYQKNRSGKVTKLVDEHNGETLQVDNVVLQICYMKEVDSHGYLFVEDHGSPALAAEGQYKGSHKMYFFTGGKVVEGYWERMDDEKPAKYYDTDGNELVFNQGKTMICQVWDIYEDYIKYK